MLSTFLFLVFFSLYMWLYYKPNRTSSQHRRYGSAALAAATPSQTTPTARIPNAEAPTSRILELITRSILELEERVSR